MAVFEPQFRLVEAWLAAAEGHVSGAISRAVEAADLAKASGQRAVEMFALSDAARFGDLTSLQRLVDVAQNIGGRLAVVHATYAAALLGVGCRGIIFHRSTIRGDRCAAVGRGRRRPSRGVVPHC